MVAWHCLAWLVLAIVAILNGILREYTYGKRTTELAAHQISTVIAILLAAGVVTALHHIWPLQSAGQAFTIGGIWLLLTIAFEFGFGHYVAGHAWSKLFADYNIIAGRMWLLFLLWVFISPYVIHTHRAA